MVKGTSEGSTLAYLPDADVLEATKKECNDKIIEVIQTTTSANDQNDID